MLFALILLLAGGYSPADAPKTAREWLLAAETHAKQKDETSAIAAAEKAESLGGKDPAILQSLANFYATSLRDFAKAAALGARYAELATGDSTRWRRLASFCLSTGLVDQAIAAGIRGVAVDDSPQMRSLLGRAYLERKEFAKGIAELKAAVDLNRFDEDAHFRLAQAFLIQQDFPSAISVLENARKTFDKSPQIELALGVALYGSRQFPEAIDQFLKTMSLAPDVPQPYIFLGRILDLAMDRLPEVTERFARFAARNPESHLGHLLHAKALVAQLPATGDPPQAQAAFSQLEKALKLKEDEAETHYLLGLLLDRKREYAKAVTHLERSVQLNPNESAAHYRLARVYDRLGRAEDAERERALHEKLSQQEASAPRPLQ
jgi:tetratricopeptide (TPR) repeat protein